MALSTTTLASPVALIDNFVSVAAVAGFAVGMKLRIDQEDFLVTKGWNGSSLQVPVLRGQNGSATAAHSSGANVNAELASDLPLIGPPQVAVQYAAQMPVVMQSFGAGTTALPLPSPGVIAIYVLNGTGVLTIAVPPPTKDMDGTILILAASGKAAHVVTFTGGLGAGAAASDVATFGAAQQGGMISIALNGAWVSLGVGAVVPVVA